MSIKTKLTLSLLAVILVFCGALREVLQRVVGPSFEALELEEARKDIDRVVQKIEGEIDDLDRLAQDWGVWDDAYNFVAGKNPGFVESNVYDGIHDSTDVVLIQVCDWDGRVLVDSRDPKSPYRGVELRAFPKDRLPEHSPLRNALLMETSVKGLLQTDWGLLVVSAQPIMKNGSVGPALGTMLMARALDEDNLVAYRNETHTEFDLVAPRAALLAELNAAPGDGSLRASEPHVVPVDREVLTAASLIRDVMQRPVAIIEAHIPRAIARRGEEAIRSAWVSSLVAGLFLLAVLYALLQRSVVAPLERFTQQALSLRPSDQALAGLDLERGDEIGKLAQRFAAMLHELEEFQQKLADTSRQAGMSEVATNVLHNVGNMLNSVGVASSMVQERIGKLPHVQMAKLATLLRDKGPELANWVANDPAGKRLPEAVAALDRMLTESQAALQAECRDMVHRVGQVSELVRNQQSLARHAGNIEQVSLSEQVEVALRLIDPKRHGVAVERRFFPIAHVTTERQKLLQVVVNLIKNAIEAFDDVERKDRRIVIAIEAHGATARLSVADNAIGIAPESLSTIFQHGFTTKSGGHGFGLHSAANSMTELGGALRVDSAGLGHGATFTIEVPFAPKDEAKPRPRPTKRTPTLVAKPTTPDETPRLSA